MRILLVTDLYPPHFMGGYEIKCKLHAEELARRGHVVSVLTSNWRAGKSTLEGYVSRLLHTNRDDQQFNSSAGIPDLLGLHRRYNQLKRMLACRENYRIAYDTIATFKPDVVYLWQLNDVSISPALAAQDQGIPTVYRLDDYWLANLRKELCLEPNTLKRMYRAAIIGVRDFERIDHSHMFVVSRSVMRSYVDSGFPEKNIAVIPEGVPSDILLRINELPNPMSKNQFRLVYVGRLVPDKGVHVALKALGHLVYEVGIPNIALDIIGVGSGDYLQQLKNLIAALGLENHTDFIGFVEHQEVLARFLKYDAVLIPSLWEEPLSGTIAEAMARGLPVIATDRGGNPEIISNGENGLLVPPDDAWELAQAIMVLVKNPALVKKFQLNALNTVRENYLHERIVDRVEDYFEELLLLRTPSRSGE